MKIADCELLIPNAIAQFNKTMHCHFAPEVILLGKASTRLGSKRSMIFQLCGDEEFEYARTTKGEMIYGTREKAILMYPFEITCKAEFEEVLYHELGHLLTYSDNHAIYEMLKAVTSIEDEHGEACFGSKLWFEFVAQAISNFVADREPSIYTGPKQCELLSELHMALPGLGNKTNKDVELLIQNGIEVNLYNLAHYFALLLTDPTIDYMVENKPECSIGFDLCSDREAACLDEIAAYLQEQLNKKQFWVITEDFLTELAYMISDLWNVRLLEKMRT